MQLTDLYQELRVPQDRNPWASSGRNEASNVVVVQIEPEALREANASERRKGIAKVHEFDRGANDATDPLTPEQLLSRAYMRADVAWGYDHASCVRAIVACDEAGWQLLPNPGQVVEFDERSGICKIVFFD